ncbi:MAG: WD40/YVTN/BNR-like repeat-containing protein [Bryobacteraceae bacterium]
MSRLLCCWVVIALPALAQSKKTAPPAVPQWTRTAAPSRSFAAIAIDPAETRVVYAAAGEEDRGAFKSADSGRTFKPINNSGPFLSMALDPKQKGAVYLGPSHSILKSIDGGASWRELQETGSGGFRAIVASPDVAGTAFAAVDSGWGVYRTETGGVRWDHVFPHHDVRALTIDPSNRETLFAGTRSWQTQVGGIFQSTDGGDTWKRVLTHASITSVAVAASDSTVVYAGTEGEGVFKSASGGANWQSVNTGLTHKVVRCVVVDPNSASVVYAATWEGGVFRSTNGGELWAPMNEGLGNLYVHTLAINPSDPEELFAGTDAGVFRWGKRK